MAAWPCKNTLKSGAECGASRNHAIHSRFHPEFHEYMKDKPVGLQPMSAGMKAFRRESGYDKAAKAARGTACQIMSPVCTGTAEHLHEVLPRGRAGGLKASLRLAPAVEACDACNGWVMEHQVWARERGFLVSLKDVQK
jgi:hypothetical protein